MLIFIVKSEIIAFPLSSEKEHYGEKWNLQNQKVSRKWLNSQFYRTLSKENKQFYQ